MPRNARFGLASPNPSAGFVNPAGAFCSAVTPGSDWQIRTPTVCKHLTSNIKHQTFILENAG